MTICVADYLLLRLQELGIYHIFGVPGDYNLELLDHVVNSDSVQWIGNCNELNSAYAADSYARIKGMGALITTFGVGELSAINGIAGAYAEYIPVVNIVGMPALTVQNKKAWLHHNLSSDNYLSFLEMHIPVTSAQVMLTAQDPGTEIDRLLTICWQEKRPVYIGIPADVGAMLIESPTHALNLSQPAFALGAAKEAADNASRFIRAAKKPIIILDAYIQRQHLLPIVKTFIEKTQLPFVTTPMGKALIDEDHPCFLGWYMGKFSDEFVLQQLADADCVISFGLICSDVNTGMFTGSFSENNSIDIQKNLVRVKNAYYPKTYIEDFIPLLLAQWKVQDFIMQPSPCKTRAPFVATQNIITDTRFWQRMEAFFQPGDIILAELGTCVFGLLGSKVPHDTLVIMQIVWASIGYTVGALLGAIMAAPTRRAVLFIGDGSLQETGQEISTMLHYKLYPIIFLINNDGYTIERMVHGDKAIYNDIQRWNYQALPYIYGENVWSTKVSNENELEIALNAIADHPNQLIFIEVITTKMDAPPLLRKMFQR